MHSAVVPHPPLHAIALSSPSPLLYFPLLLLFLIRPLPPSPSSPSMLRILYHINLSKYFHPELLAYNAYHQYPEQKKSNFLIKGYHKLVPTSFYFGGKEKRHFNIRFMPRWPQNMCYFQCSKPYLDHCTHQTQILDLCPPCVPPTQIPSGHKPALERVALRMS